MRACDAEKLSLYFDDMLDGDEAVQIAAHISECAQCRAYLNDLAQIKDSLAGFGELEVPDGFRTETVETIRESGNKQIDFVIARLARMRGRVAPHARTRLVPQLWSRMGTVAAGLLLTLVLFGGLGSFLTAPGQGAASGGAYMMESGHVTAEAAPAEAEAAPAAAAAPMEGPAPAAAAPMPMAAPMEAPVFAEPGMFAGTTVAEQDSQNAAEDFAAANIEAAAPKQAEPSIVSTEPIAGGSEQTIKHYSIALTVDDFDAAVAAIRRLPGYNATSNMRNYDGEAHKAYSLTRKVAVSDYERIKSELHAIGEITFDHETATRIYIDMEDTAARIRSLETQTQRLLDLLERSDSVTAMAQIEHALETRGDSLDMLRTRQTGHIRALAEATVDISIDYYDTTPQYKTVESFGERLRARFIRSVNVTLGFIENASVFVSSIGFPLLLVCLVGFVIYLIMNTLRRRRGHGEE